MGRVRRDRADQPTHVDYETHAYQVQRVAADGNCFYRCVALALDDGRDPPALRALLANSAMLTPEERLAAQDESNYAGDREIAALAAAIGRSIVAHEGTYEDLTGTVVRKPAIGAGPAVHVLLLYNPAEEQGHFNLML